MIYQIRSRVIEDAPQNRGNNQRVSHDGPGIALKMHGHKLLQVDNSMNARDRKPNAVCSRSGIEHLIEDRLNQQQPEGFQKSDGRQEQHSNQQLQGERKHVTDDARYLPHEAASKRRQSGTTKAEVRMRRKALFY